MDANPSEEQLIIMEVPKLNRIEPVRVKALHPFLRKFRDEHVPPLEELNAFEAAILLTQESGYAKQADATLRHIVGHTPRESKHLVFG